MRSHFYVIPLLFFYDLWTRGEAYIDPGVDYYEQKYQERLVQNLTKKAHSLGFELIPQSGLNLCD